MVPCDLFDLLETVEAAAPVKEAQREYSQALKALKALLPAAAADTLWPAILDIDAAHGAVMVAAARAGFAAAGGDLREDV